MDIPAIRAGRHIYNPQLQPVIDGVHVGVGGCDSDEIKTVFCCEKPPEKSRAVTAELIDGKNKRINPRILGVFHAFG